MKIAVIGAGAMGSLFAGYLAEKKTNVWVYDIWKEHVEKIIEEGLTMTRNKSDRRVRLKATIDPTEPGIVDLALLFVKYGHTRQAVQDSLPMIGPQSVVLTLQNGIGNVEILQEMLPNDRILFGLTTLTSELLGPGHIEESFQGQGDTYFWPLSGKVDERTEQVCAVFNRAGIHTQVSSNVQKMIWKKLIVNACYNTLSAIFRLKVGDFVDQPDLKPVFDGIVHEIVQVAQKKGISLNKEEAHHFLNQVGGEARDHFPSMLIDVKNERKTEIDCLNGAVVREGEKMGIPTHYNKTLVALIRVIENTFSTRLE